MCAFCNFNSLFVLQFKKVPFPFSNWSVSTMASVRIPYVLYPKLFRNLHRLDTILNVLDQRLRVRAAVLALPKDIQFELIVAKHQQ